eukprot:2870971-Rhodomonas_salina.3
MHMDIEELAGSIATLKAKAGTHCPCPNRSQEAMHCTEQACVDENYGGITGRTCIILQTSYVMSRTDTDASLSAVLHMC